MERSRLALEFHGRVASPDQLREAIQSARDVYRVEAVGADLYLFQLVHVEPDDGGAADVAEWSQSVRFSAASIDREAGVLVLNLEWSIRAPVDPGQTVFVHVRNASGAVVAQADGDPIGGSSPLSAWSPGQIIHERRPLVSALNLPTGNYTVAIGLYDRGTLQRTAPIRANVPVTDGALVVGSFNIP